MQECIKCGATWNFKKIIESCPFCGADLREKRKAESIEDAFVIILKRHGIDAFRSGSVLGLLGDYAPTLVRERKLVRIAVESGAYQALCEAKESEREHILNKYISVLTESFFIDERWAKQVLLWCLSVLSPSLHSSDPSMIEADHIVKDDINYVDNSKVLASSKKADTSLEHDSFLRKVLLQRLASDLYLMTRKK